MLSHAEGACPQNCMVERTRNQCWKSSFYTEVCSCSNFPAEAVLRIKEAEIVDSVDDRTTSRSIGGHGFQNFEMFDAKIASALKEIVTNPLSE